MKPIISIQMFKEQFKESVPVLFLCLIVSSIFLGFTVLLHIFKGIPYGDMTRDILSVLEAEKLWIGFISQIGIFFWAAASAICFFAAYFLVKNEGNFKFKNFLFVSGFVSIFLGLDDTFLLHERVLNKILFSEIIVFIIYAVIILIWLIKFINIILRTEYILLLLAFSFFVISLFVDIVFEESYASLHFFEDGAKFIGLVFWFFYFFLTPYKLITLINQKKDLR